MKIKTSDLTGPALDWAVAKCENISLTSDGYIEHVIDHLNFEFTKYSPSTDWSQGGPIIERESIDGRAPRPMWLYWKAYSSEWNQFGLIENNTQYGDTLLIAAMRCYVQSKLGDEVEIPDELF